MPNKPIIPGAAHEVKSKEFSGALSDANASEAGSGLARQSVGGGEFTRKRGRTRFGLLETTALRRM